MKGCISTIALWKACSSRDITYKQIYNSMKFWTLLSYRSFCIYKAVSSYHHNLLDFKVSLLLRVCGRQSCYEWHCRPHHCSRTQFTRMWPICSTVPSGLVASPILANRSEGHKSRERAVTHWLERSGECDIIVNLNGCSETNGSEEQSWPSCRGI